MQRTILRLAFPGGKVRPKAPPYPGDPEPEPKRSTNSASSNGHGEPELVPFP